MSALAIVAPAAGCLVVGLAVGTWLLARWFPGLRRGGPKSGVARSLEPEQAREGVPRPARFGRPGQPPGPTFADLLALVVQSSHSGMAVLNRHGDVVLHNPRATELGLVSDARADSRVLGAAEQVVRTGRSADVDLSPLEHRGRGPRAVLGHVRPLQDGFVVVEAEDTSEKSRLEATRRDFVANVSHELKTPVGAVGLLAEAVLDAADDPDEVRRFCTKILRESTRLGALVTELIALSRLTGAERLPELAVVEVDEVVNEALARCRVVAESTGIGVTVDEESDLMVDGDRTLLVTALSNLIDNAIAYSPPSSAVSISRRVIDGTVEISVTDRGIGIATEHQQRVFERFFRVDPARSRATGGTGLGLAIVKHVAANHGGEVRLWSRPGTGSTFTLRLPEHTGPGLDDEHDDRARVIAPGTLTRVPGSVSDLGNGSAVAARLVYGAARDGQEPGRERVGRSGGMQ